MAPDSGDDDASALRERVRELEQTVADLKTERQRPTVGRRSVLGALAGAAGLGAVGVYGSSQPAAAQASGQVGTASDPVDVFGYNVEADNGVTTPAITDSDTGTEYDIGTFTEGEVLSDQDGDGVYTLPNGSDGIDVESVTTEEVDYGGDAYQQPQKTPSVGTTATVIHSDFNNVIARITVYGFSDGNAFVDEVIAFSGEGSSISQTVLATRDAPSGRTYSNTQRELSLAMDAGDYAVTAMPMSLNRGSL